MTSHSGNNFATCRVIVHFIFFISRRNEGGDKQDSDGSTCLTNSPFSTPENTYEPWIHHGNLIHGKDDYRLQLSFSCTSITVLISYQDVYLMALRKCSGYTCKLIILEISDRRDWPPLVTLNTIINASAHHGISQIPCVACRYICSFPSRNHRRKWMSKYIQKVAMDWSEHKCYDTIKPIVLDA